MRDNYLHYLKEKKKKKQLEEEKGRTYIETINELEKKKYRKCKSISEIASKRCIVKLS